MITWILLFIVVWFLSGMLSYIVIDIIEYYMHGRNYEFNNHSLKASLTFGCFGFISVILIIGIGIYMFIDHILSQKKTWFSIEFFKDEK